MNPMFVFVASSLSAAMTTILCLCAMPISRWLQVVDVPGHRKQHSHPTPLVGGIVLQVAILPIVAGIAVAGMAGVSAEAMIIWVAAVASMSLLGFADDRHTLSPRDRLLVSFLVFSSAAILDPMFNVGLLYFEHPSLGFGLGPRWLSVAFTTLCCVGLVNAVNMADGKNGLVTGMCLGWLGLLAWRAPVAYLPVIAIMMASISILFLFNLFGRLFLGDSGAYGLATAIGLLAIAVYSAPGEHAGRAISADELMLLFSVPVLDSFRLTYARLRDGRSPMSADRNHLHHHLQNWFGWPIGLIVYLLVALGPTALVWTVES